jgi:hypothetical protein
MTAWATVTPTIDHQSDAEAAWRILFKEEICPTTGEADRALLHWLRAGPV